MDEEQIVKDLISEHDKLWLKTEKIYREVEHDTKLINRLRIQITEADPEFNFHDPIKLLFSGMYEDTEG